MSPNKLQTVQHRLQLLMSRVMASNYTKYAHHRSCLNNNEWLIFGNNGVMQGSTYFKENKHLVSCWTSSFVVFNGERAIDTNTKSKSSHTFFIQVPTYPYPILFGDNPTQAVFHSFLDAGRLKQSVGSGRIQSSMLVGNFGLSLPYATDQARLILEQPLHNCNTCPDVCLDQRLILYRGEANCLSTGSCHKAPLLFIQQMLNP